MYEQSLAKSRDEAKRLIMCGIVYVNDERVDKAGTFFKVDPALKIELRGAKPKYVSRGGLKLEKAIKEFGLDLTDLTCMDVGASTGGFTDCMLQNGAKKVYAVDVGYGQLDYRLRNDPRVISLEKTNIRYIDPKVLSGDRLDFVSIDVSFISLRKVLPSVNDLLKGKVLLVCLIKPQFEAGKSEVGKKGVVRDPKIHKKVLLEVLKSALLLGFEVKGFSYSPIKGPEGNIEFLMYMTSWKEKECDEEKLRNQVLSTVDEAHRVLD